MKAYVKEKILKLICTKFLSRRDYFTYWEKYGYHVVPNHFYSPIPDTRELNPNLWQHQSELIGLEMNPEEQLEFAEYCRSHFKEEYDQFPLFEARDGQYFYLNNGNYQSVDAEMLYCMIRRNKPRKYVEIGSGFTTLLAHDAIANNYKEDHSYNCQITAIEPFPRDFLLKEKLGINVIQKKVQNIPLAKFQELDRNDILFIDSSHVLDIGSDVHYEYCEILPRLQKGVLIHLHDIFLPANYPKGWILNDHRFWNEQYLVQAFLAFNDSFRIVWAGSYMHINFPELLEKVFNSYKRDEAWPASIWLEKVK